MKILLALVLTFVSLSSFAKSSGAVDKFTSFLPVGEYSGVNDQGVSCQVSVGEVNYPKKDIQVRVVVGNTDLTKLIEDGSEFGYKDYKREFVQTDRNQVGSDDVNYVERIVRTVSAGDKKQYVVVSYSVVMNTDRNDEAAECIVDLN